MHHPPPVADAQAEGVNDLLGSDEKGCIPIQLSPDLPGDLVEQILVKLPVKSLLRFKSVCKSWKSLISGSKFVNDHIQANLNKSRRSFLLFLEKSRLEFPEEPLIYQVTIGDSTVAEQVYMHSGLEEFLYKGYDTTLEVSHCNGVLCLADRHHRRIAFYNPALGEHLFLRAPSPNPYLLEGYAFGYDPKDDQYKYVRILKSKEASRPSKAEVYTLQTGKWREIELDARYSIRDIGAYLKGRFYWIDRKAENVLSLDMCEEKFSSIDLPYSGDWRGGEYQRVLVQGESLVYVLTSYSYKTGAISIEMWEMNQDGGGWGKHLRVEPLVGLGNLLAFWKEREALIEDTEGRVWSYNLDTEERREILIPSPGDDAVTYAYSYVASLVSVKVRNSAS